MKKATLMIAILLCGITIGTLANDNDQPSGEKATRKGWSFGVLPSIAFDQDLGFQLGALTNVYYFGDGSQYPDYLHSFYAEAATTSKHYSLFRLSYDSKYLIPNHRLSVDLTYMPDLMCDFYGFNGYATHYNKAYTTQGDADYLTRAYYKFQRDLFRLSADLQGTIAQPWYWNVGLGILQYKVGSVDIDRLNKYEDDEEDKLPVHTTLFDQYVSLGYISKSESTGGTHPYLHGGLTYDTRDRQQNPQHGIHADAFLTYYAGLGDMKDYNNLKLNVNWRQYLPIVPQRLTLAYRIGGQINLAGHSPFYLNTYLNQLYMQRILYEGLGGGNSIRGIMRNRILAEGVAFANIELRTQLFHFRIGKNMFYIGINPFMDAGMVLQPYESVLCNPNDPLMGIDEDKLYSPHLSAGCGLKAAMNDNFVLSVDWATALDKQDNGKVSNLYIKMGYMF